MRTISKAQRQEGHARDQAEQEQRLDVPAAQHAVVDHANPGVDELIDAIGIELVTDGRDAMIEEVWRAVLADVVVVPLHHQIMVWALLDGRAADGRARLPPLPPGAAQEPGCALEPVILG